MRLFYNFTYWVRFIIATPFFLIGNPLTFLCINVYWFYYRPAGFVMTLVYSGVLCGLAHAIWSHIRPAEQMHPEKLPERRKDAGPGKAAVLVKQGGSTPSLSAITRQLPRELRSAAAGPVDRMPAAIAFEQRQAASNRAEKADPQTATAV